MRTSRLLALLSPVALLWSPSALAVPVDDVAEAKQVASVPGALLPLALEAAPAATAEDVEEPLDDEDADEDADEEPGIFESYADYWDWKFDQLLSKPLWGLSTQLPAGIFKFRYEYTNARADSYYDRDGEEVQLLPLIEFTDFPNRGDKLVIDPRVKGGGGEHNFQFAYGITDPWDLFLEMPFTTVHTTMDLRAYMNGQPASDLEFAMLRGFITSNGRPMPNTEYDTTASLGDMRFGSSWNYYRSDWFSTSVTPSVFFPTGNRADANNDLTFLLGPEIDRGAGVWAINFTNSYDVRPVEWLVFSFEIQATYQFGHDRQAPDWLPITDCARLEDPQVRAQRGCSSGSRPYDYAYDLEQSTTFPNLDGLGDTFHVEPLLSTGFAAAVSFELSPIPIQFGYQFDRSEAPTIVANGEGGSAVAFEQLVDSLQLWEGKEVHAIALGTSIPLFPIYIPISLQPKAKWIVAGKNTMKLKDQFGIAAELYLPMDDIFRGGRPEAEAETATETAVRIH